MPNPVENLCFGDFSLEDWHHILRQVSSSRPPVEFLCDLECSDEDEASAHKEEFACEPSTPKSVPTGLEDSGVEIGLESEHEGQVPSTDTPVLFLSDSKADDKSVVVQFGGTSIVEEKEATIVTNYLQDAENFPPLAGQAQNDERSRKRRRKRRQHQRSGDVPCSSSEDSDREKSPASMIDRSSRVRGSSSVTAVEKNSSTSEGNAEDARKNDSKDSEEVEDAKASGKNENNDKKESNDTSSTDTKSTTETVPTAGDSSSNQSDVDINKEKANTSKSDSEITVKATKPAISSWADLFRNSNPKSHNLKVSSPSALSKSATPTKENNASKPEDADITVVVVDEDERAFKTAETLKKLKLDYVRKALLPRGLINKANWCYINATLQALVACPPFYNLLSEMEPLKNKETTTCTPILDSMVKFCHEFNLLPKPATGKNGKVEFRTGSSFEPNCIYKMLTTIKSSLSSKGRQEDAEEFLSCILNGIHEEMLKVMKLIEPVKPEPTNSEQIASDNPSVVAVNGQDLQESDDDAGDWEQVGPRNKSSITRTAIFPHSLMSDIFGGYLRSSLHQTGAKESANVEPFFDLQLDIQNASCIEDALTHLAVKEELQGYTCSKTNSQVDISRRVTFESLPRVLILHLKRFIYQTNVTSKLLKPVDYPLELVIGKELLSPNVRTKYNTAQKTYNLLAVVYHHGKTVSGGHYTADVHHPVHGWIRTDDTKLKVVPTNHVLKPIQGKDPYLLYYYRTDQIA